MDILRHLRFVLFLYYILEICTCPTERCQRQIFYEVCNKSYPGHFLLSEGPWPLHKCRRLCRQYRECLSFGMEWRDDNLGMCILYNGGINATELVLREKVTIYMPCPESFQWYAEVSKCYSSVISELIHGIDTINACKKVHPEATPVEPRNQSQMDIIKGIAGGYDVWLGVYKPHNSQILHDFRYYSDGTNITYHNWFGINPNNYNNNEYCVAIFSSERYRWGDCFCGQSHAIICELLATNH